MIILHLLENLNIMATITWNIDRMEVYPMLGTLTNCVSSVYWTCLAADVDANGNTVSATQTGYCKVPYIAEEPFIEYASLTQDEVLNWVWTHGSIREAIEDIVNGKLAVAMNPVVTVPLPWSG
jgi:hypothetical protein